MVSRKKWGQYGGAYRQPSYAGVCPECGKKRYGTRQDAKDFAKRVYPGEKMSIYRCGPYWHIGHLPPAVVSGQAERPRTKQVDW